MEDATCEICGEEIETTLHVVRDCKIPQQVWSLLIPTMVHTMEWRTENSLLWIQYNMKLHTEI